jgi:hypothetical protein
MKIVGLISLPILCKFFLLLPEQNFVHRIILNTHLSESQQKIIITEIEKLQGVKTALAEGNMICVESTKETTAENLKEVVVKYGFFIENYVEYSSIDVSCSKFK